MGPIGGEEFGIPITGASLKAAFQILDGFRTGYAQVQHLSPKGPAQSTFSAGIVAGDSSFAIPDDSWGSADRALFEAKAGGRNCV